MPANTAVAALILGGILLLIALVGGAFKIFGAEVAEKPGRAVRVVAGVVGSALIIWGLLPSPSLPGYPNPSPSRDQDSNADVRGVERVRPASPVEKTPRPATERPTLYRFVFHEQGQTYHGKFEKQGDEAWIQTSDKPGDPEYHFQEKSADGNWIVLRDEGRSMDLRLPINGGPSQWQSIGDAAWNNHHAVTPD